MPTANTELTPREVAEVRDSFVQLWGSLGTFWGVSPTTARVFGWLFSQAEASDAEEIMSALELSRGAVSMAGRELREWGLVHVEKAPGSRRVLYRAEADLEKVIRHVVEIRKRREWDPILENLQGVDPGPGGPGQHQRQPCCRQRLAVDRGSGCPG